MLQDTAESDISNDPLAANAAAAAIMESKEEDAVAAAGRNDEEDQDLHIQDAPQTTAAVNDVIQPDQTVNTGSQHVLKVCLSMFEV